MVVSVSLTVVIFMKNTYLEKLETTILCFSNIGCCYHEECDFKRVSDWRLDLLITLARDL
jgi:hypothetical protein